MPVHGWVLSGPGKLAPGCELLHLGPAGRGAGNRQRGRHACGTGAGRGKWWWGAKDWMLRLCPEGRTRTNKPAACRSPLARNYTARGARTSTRLENTTGAASVEQVDLEAGPGGGGYQVGADPRIRGRGVYCTGGGSIAKRLFFLT